MNLMDNAFTRYVTYAVAGLILALLLYLVALAARALFRQARALASEAGHRPAGAAIRALLRMAAWSSFFGLFYLAAVMLGRRLGWLALPAVAVGLAGVIAGALTADRILTMAPEDRRGNLVVGATVLGLLAIFASVAWWAA